MNWIRVATKMKGDPRIGAIAAACKVRVPEAVGLVCCVLMELPDHAKDGDVRHVPDVILEQWALWTGKPGQFAEAFRDAMCDETGAVRSWEKYNGAAIRKAERDNARPKPAKNPRETRAKPALDLRESSAKPAGNGTERNDTTPTQAVGVVRADARQPSIGGRVAYAQQLNELRSAGLPHERAALDALVQAHPSPDVLVLELHATASGMHVVRGQHSGRAADIADVMRAVAEMAAAAKPFSVSLFRGFVRRVADRPPEPPSAEEREAARLEKEITARQPAVVVEAPRSEAEKEQLRAQREAAMAAFRAEFHKYNPPELAA